MIETQRLILRGLKKSDAPAMFEYAQNPNVGRNAGWKEHENVRESRLTIKYFFANRRNCYGIFLKENDKLIGTISLTHDPKRTNDRSRALGYSMSQEYWGRGIMTEAAQAIIKDGFEHEGIDIISAYCYPGNTRSKRVLEKCGFKYEGTLKCAEIAVDGTVRDNDCFSLLKKDV